MVKRQSLRQKSYSYRQLVNVGTTYNSQDLRNIRMRKSKMHFTWPMNDNTLYLLLKNNTPAE